MKYQTYAYIRVSSDYQNVSRQVRDMTKLGIKKRNIIIEKASGKNFNRKKYLQLLENIKEGDTLYISSIDRLGREYDGIIREWNKITKVLKVIIKVLDSPILDTDKKHLTLMEKYLQDMALLTLAFQAEQEWRNIKERQKAGITIAKEKGIPLGRPKIVRSEKEIYTIKAWQNGVINVSEAMQKLNLKKSAFYKLANEVKAY
ncbi:MAG: recombinase family protein [Defluviitaleaceae bacterium]|nr:recombinase family protein [Defluviitaleaceae bacterium]